jgi:hypothetical protein
LAKYKEKEEKSTKIFGIGERERYIKNLSRFGICESVISRG